MPRKKRCEGCGNDECVQCLCGKLNSGSVHYGNDDPVDQLLLENPDARKRVMGLWSEKRHSVH
ncbi:hypothetical protein ACFL26_00955 [Patescibacteria group bacterium]